MKIEKSAKVTATGAYRMPAGAYHADPCPEPSLSNSLAQLLLDASPRHVYHAHPRLNPFFEPDAGTRETALGSACHALLLGQGAALAVIDADDYRSKLAKEERAAADEKGEIAILRPEYERAQAIVASARQQLRAGELCDLADGRGDAEVVLAADDGGTWLRAMLDWWSADRALIVDYKTTRGRASAAAFVSQIARMGYDFQAAWYRRVAALVDPGMAGRTRFVFAAQEAEPPYALSLLEIGEADLSVAERKVDAALDLWRECVARGEWPGYPAGVQLVQLPEWHTRRWLDRELADSDSPQWAFAGGR